MKRVLLLVSLIIIMFPSLAQAWWDTNWDYRKELTVSSSLVEVTGNYVVVLQIQNDSDLYSHLTSTSGYDIAIIAGDDSTELAYERSYFYRDTGNSQIDTTLWIEVDNLSSSSDTTLYLYYGNSNQTTDRQDTTATWDGEYQLVMHMEESGVAEDSTNNISFSETGTISLDPTGQIDGCQSFPTDVATFDIAPASTIYVGGSGADQGGTLMIWFECPSGAFSSTDSLLGYQGADEDSYIATWSNDDEFRLQTSGNQNTYNFSTESIGADWAFAAITRTASDTWYCFLNDEKSSGSLSMNTFLGIRNIGNGLNSTNYDWEGDIDEIIILNEFKSDEWVYTCYNNQNDPTPSGSFWDMAVEENNTPTIENTPALCSDGIDNDGENGKDCADPNCEGVEHGSDGYVCEDEASFNDNCCDTFDNDGDGDIDCCDSFCDDAFCSSSTISDINYSELWNIGTERPTGLGDTCDLKASSVGKTAHADIDAGSTQEYWRGYWRVSQTDLSEGEHFRPFLLLNSSTTDLAVRATMEMSGGNLELYFEDYHTSHTPNNNPTESAIIPDGTWIYAQISYTETACSIQAFTCNNGIYNRIINYSATGLSGGASPDFLRYGVRDLTDCDACNNVPTILYHDEWDYSNSEQPGPAGMVKQNVAVEPYFALGWWPTLDGSETDVLVYEDFDARAYHDDNGMSNPAWTKPSANASVNVTWTDVIINGQYSARYNTGGGTVEDDAYVYLQDTAHFNTDPLPTHVYTSFKAIFVATNGTDDIKIAQLVGDAGDCWTARIGAPGSADGENQIHFYQGDTKVYTYPESGTIDHATTTYLIRVEWQAGSDVGFNILVEPIDDDMDMSFDYTGTITSSSSYVEGVRFGILEDPEGGFQWWQDDIFLTTSSFPPLGPENLLADGDDSTYFFNAQETQGFFSMEDTLVVDPSAPAHLGDIKALRMFFKAKEVGVIDHRLVVGYYHEQDTLNQQWIHPQLPVWVGTDFEWMYREVDRYPAINNLRYNPNGLFESRLDKLDVVRTDTGIGGYVMDFDTLANTITVAKLMPLMGIEGQYIYEGAYFDIRQNETLNLFDYDQFAKRWADGDSTTTAIEDNDIQVGNEQDRGEWSDNEYAGWLVRCDTDDSGEVDADEIKEVASNDSDTLTFSSAFPENPKNNRYELVRRVPVASDWDTENLRTALTWSEADSWLYGFKTCPETRFEDDFSDGGGEISETYGQAVSAGSNQEYISHFIGTTAWTDGIGIKARASGPAYIKVRYGLSEGGVEDNTGSTWTTAASSLLSSSSDYTFQVNILEGQSVTDTNGDSHTVSYSGDGLYNTVVYYDVLIKGENAANYYSMARFEGSMDSLETSNPVWADMTNNLLATKTFPASTYSDTLAFVVGSDSHGIDSPGTWTQIGSQLAANDGSFFLLLGDEVPDPGDVLYANRYMWKSTVGFQNKRFTYTETRSRWPYIKDYSDHDYFANDASKTGAYKFLKNRPTYLRTYIGMQGNKEYTPFPQDSNGDYKLSPDYEGTYWADLTDGVVSSASTGTPYTISDNGRTFGDSSTDDWVAKGMAVHNLTKNAVSFAESASGDTITVNGQCIDFHGEALDWEVGDEFRVSRAGIWHSREFGNVAEFLVTDTRLKSDPVATPGCDYYDGTAYESGYKDAGTVGTQPSAFKLYEALQNFTSTVNVGDVVIVTKADTIDYYAHIKTVDDDETLTLNRDIADEAGSTFVINEAGGTAYDTLAEAHEAGHIQRTWTENTLNNTTALAKFILSDTNIKHNAGRWHDAIPDRDGVCYGNSAELAKEGSATYDSDLYSTPLLTKLDIQSISGGDADFDLGNYVLGGSSGARARIKDVVDNGDGIYTLSFYTEMYIDPYHPDCPGWHSVIHGEFVDEVVYEYTDCALSTASGTQAITVAPSGKPFMANNTTTSGETPYDYNRFWKASGCREYSMNKLSPVPNIFYLVGDRHYRAIDDATHTDDFYLQLDPGPLGPNYTFGFTDWGIDLDDSGHIERDELAFYPHSMTLVDNGITESGASYKLYDSDQNFASTVEVNDIAMVKQGSDIRWFAHVTNVDSNSTLTLDKDIGTANCLFKIYRGYGIDPVNDGIFSNEIDPGQAGGFILIQVDATANTVDVQIMDADGEVWGPTESTFEADAIPLSYIFRPSLIWIYEDWEDDGAPGPTYDWEDIVSFADDYWLDEALGL